MKLVNSLGKKHNKSKQLTKIYVTNFGTQNLAPYIFATVLSVINLRDTFDGIKKLRE